MDGDLQLWLTGDNAICARMDGDRRPFRYELASYTETVFGDETACKRPGPRHRDLLAEHRADRHLGPVDVPRHTAAGDGAHERADDRVAAKRVYDRFGVCVDSRFRL